MSAKNKPCPDTNAKRPLPLPVVFLAGLLLLGCGVAVWLGVFYFSYPSNLAAAVMLAAGAAVAFGAVSFSRRLLCQAGWKAFWPARIFCYAVVVGVLVKRGQSGLQGVFFFLWWVLFLALFLLWLIRLRANNKRL